MSKSLIKRSSSIQSSGSASIEVICASINGLRSTFRRRAESAARSCSREVYEHGLAQSLPDKVEAASRRADLIEKRKVLMQA